MRRVRVVGSVVASVAALTAGVASAQQVDDPVGDVTRLSLEELAAVEVTSVSRRPEQLNQAAASVFVITADDIRRSGAISLPGSASRPKPRRPAGQRRRLRDLRARFQWLRDVEQAAAL